MSVIETGGIDCDMIPPCPQHQRVILCRTHWRDNRHPRAAVVCELDSLSYRRNSPSRRPDWTCGTARADGLDM